MPLHTNSAGDHQHPDDWTTTNHWSQFASARSLTEYWENWLALQCSLLPNAHRAVLIVRGNEQSPFQPVTNWPEDDGQTERLDFIAERVLEERCGLVEELDPVDQGRKGVRYGIAYPVLVDDTLHGVVAVEIAASTEQQLTYAMQQLQWGVAWLELVFRRQRNSEERALFDRLKSSVDLLSGVLAEKHFAGAAMVFVTELATLLGCDRVSLGFVRGHHVKVQMLSHSAQFSQRMNLVRGIGRAMEEAIAQRSDIFFPLPDQAEPLVVREHDRLVREHGSGTILTVPLYGNGRYYGALTLERPAETPFNNPDLELCRSLSALAGPALKNKQLNDRPLPFKIWDSGREQLHKLFGPRFLGRKLILALLLGLGIFFSLATDDYRLSADTVLEGEVRRVVVAPFNGYIREASVRAGDRVAEGMLMCALDDRDLRLERINRLSQRSQLQRQRQGALAGHDRAQVNILNAQLDQADAQFDLVESQLARTQIGAPFDGIVLSGDLSQRLGGLVEQGEVLFEVAPLDAYRVILKVDERRIADVVVGQRGVLILTALPEKEFPFFIQKITPISTAADGVNYFRVEARLDEISERLRPGMEGIGKVTVDRRKLIDIWTRSLREWLRLWFWSWLP